MAKKVRLTNFARFFIFLIIVVPLAYLGASYINGEDPKENINKLLNKEILSTDSKRVTEEPSPQNEESSSQKDIAPQSVDLSNDFNENAIEELKSEVNFYKSKVDELKTKVEKLEKENYKLRQSQ